MIFILIPLLVFGLWALTIHLDKKRVREHFAKRGDSIVSIYWKIFGHGWLSETSKEGGGNRIYKVEYRDVYGNIRRVWCKTAMFSGVFLAEDIIITPATVEGRTLTAEEKVELLEEELRKLRIRNNAG